MKAISIQQPFAWAILHAGKDIENRKWNTHHRGLIAIHAPATRQRDHWWPRGVRKPTEDELHLSAIVGVVELVDVVERSRSKWFEGPFGLVLANPRPLSRPIPCKGMLSLWTIPPEILRAIRRQLRAASGRV